MINKTWQELIRQRLNNEFWDDQVVDQLLDFIVEQKLETEFNTYADDLLSDYETKELKNELD